MKNMPDRSDPNRFGGPEEPIIFHRSPEMSDELFEAFMESVRAFESAPTTTLAHLLIRDGVELPSPDNFTEESVHEKLWEVIHAMARLRHFLYSTDHLSDLELYRCLWEETLNERTEEITREIANTACHIDLVSGGSDEATQAWLRHYALDMDRELWAAEFPDDPMPAHVDPPYDRDRHLPEAYPSGEDQSG